MSQTANDRRSRPAWRNLLTGRAQKRSSSTARAADLVRSATGTASYQGTSPTPAGCSPLNGAAIARQRFSQAAAAIRASDAVCRQFMTAISVPVSVPLAGGRPGRGGNRDDLARAAEARRLAPFASRRSLCGGRSPRGRSASAVSAIEGGVHRPSYGGRLATRARRFAAAATASPATSAHAHLVDEPAGCMGGFDGGGLRRADVP